MARSVLVLDGLFDGPAAAAAGGDGARAVPEVLGPRALPPGHDHPHASEEARTVAEQGTILRAQVGQSC